MISKIAKYPWGDRTIFYDSFVYKVVDEDVNKVIEEVWVKTDDEMKILQKQFDKCKKDMTEVSERFNRKLTEYNTSCFGYLIDADDDLGFIKVKDRKGIKSEHRILVYLCGFLSDKQTS